ncbi:MAG: serine/threonine protein kinase [Symploca sp. SIO2C1]|nr:serine/threonine protein kinase [Symploca sp. SIO2C1]
MSWVAGQQLQGSKYTIERKLGTGGFGVTYLATTASHEQVVIKTLNETIIEHPDFAKFQEDFQNEALRLGKCSHPHIVKIYEFFQEGPLPCLVLEYIDGEDLASWVTNRDIFPEAEALHYIQQIGEALVEVHRSGFLHRDLKPQNIMLRNGNLEAVLIDFGIAREFTPNLTQTHTQFVSDNYSPIEQYDRRAKRDVYTDIYSLAATLYAILTGELPMAAPVRAAGTELEPPKQFNPHLSDRVNHAIIKGMALLPEERPQSVQEWFQLLGVASASLPKPTTRVASTFRLPASPARPKPLGVLAVGVVAALASLGVSSAYYFQGQSTREELVLEEIQQLSRSGQYEACVRTANNLHKTSPQYESAQGWLNNCAEELLETAQELAKDQDFQEAIIKADKLLPVGLFEAQTKSLISQWSNNLIQQATKLYQEEGKLDEAIALIETIPNTVPTSKKAQEVIAQWQKEWAANDTLLKEAQQAFDSGNWQEVIEKASKVTTTYWQKQIRIIIQTAEARMSPPEIEARNNFQNNAHRSCGNNLECIMYMCQVEYGGTWFWEVNGSYCQLPVNLPVTQEYGRNI